MKHNTTQHNTTQHNTTQHNTTQLSFKVKWFYLTLIFVILNSCERKENFQEDNTIGINKSNVNDLMNDLNKTLLHRYPEIKILEKSKLTTREEVHHCVPDVQGTNCSTQSYGEYITTPAIYPCYIECMAYVTYQVTICVDGNGKLISLNVFNLRLEFFTGSCYNDLSDCLDELTTEENFYYYDRMQQELSFIIEGQILGSLSGIPRCPSTTLTTNYTKESCYALCIHNAYASQTITYTLGICGLTCCTRSRTVCKDNSGNLVYGTPSFSSTGTVNCSSETTIENCEGQQPCYTAPCGLY
ncbi:MAG: hypothetical protein U0V49_01795 [Saprospiraceae bacterium]